MVWIKIRLYTTELIIILQFLDISHAEIFTFHFMQTSTAYPLIGVS